jgi:hypothetical protein
MAPGSRRCAATWTPVRRWRSWGPGCRRLIYQRRDAADAARRLAVRHQLAWPELDALRAHALLDRAEGIDRGSAAKADVLHARLVPPGLDPDPLATVERLVTKQKRQAGTRRQRRGRE